ncbi:hypothetical protein [Xenorhabdus bovienii]|uniref:hypothetical protein n=1 Tax=Xenorhabdus bovienii TaxID=40576 RepID=UPI003DA4F5BC
MTDNSLTSGLFKTGAERLALLGKHHHALMQGYLEGYIDETTFSDSALKRLIAARILYRPDEQQPLMLRPLVSELIASMIADENRRQINADVAEKLEQIRNKVQAWRDAYYRADYVVAELHMQRLAEHVHDLSGQFEEAIDSLWHRLNNDFGFVSTLNEKINENARAQNQSRRLLDGLTLLDFDELIELSEGNNPLRKLLVSQLQYRCSTHHSTLLEVQRRLVDLMAKFRKQQSRSLLVSNMAAFLRQHPQYKPASYMDRRDVPVLFNIAGAIHTQASIALDRFTDRQTLAELLHAFPRPTQPTVAEFQIASSAEHGIDEAILARQQALKIDVDNFYLHAVEQSEAISAVAYLFEKHLPWDTEMWLFQVIADYHSLPQKDKKMFNFRTVEKPASQVNALRIISDVYLRLQLS